MERASKTDTRETAAKATRAAATEAKTTNRVLGLQSALGNQATVALLAAAQTKLTVGAAGDRYEQEADAVARDVVAHLHGGETSAAPIDERDRHSVARSFLQRAQAGPIGAAGGEVDAGTEAQLQSLRRGGAPLPASVRRSMEGAFGSDFSGVRLHRGGDANALNDHMSARAFTVGSDIFLGRSAPGLDTPAGEQLLAHELTHTLQQGQAPARRSLHRSPGPSAQRLFGFGKSKAPATPPMSPEFVQKLQNAIAKSEAMKRAEEMRAKGDEDGALGILESFWDKGTVEVDGKPVSLKAYKPLMFTPSERRVRQINKVRSGIAVKKGFDKSVRSGATDPKNTPYKAPGDKESAVPDVLSTVGSGGSTTSQIGGFGAQIGEHFEGAPSPNVDLKTKLLDTTYNKQGDPMYQPPSMDSKAAWGESVLSIIQGAFDVLAGVADFVKQITSKDSSKRDVAESGSDLGNKLVSTAQTVTEMVEKIQGTDVTTHLFRWVPGLSVFANAFSAVKSALALVPKAIQLHALRTRKAKVKSDGAREDMKLAISRLATRSAQHVEQESFGVGKALTNVGLNLAEVITAGGFGVPRLATIVLDVGGVLHSVGHAIADFVRANATGKARTDYFGAHKEKAAENLINTDPEFAADTILTRASEGDPEALAILKAYDIKVPQLKASELVNFAHDKHGTLNYDYDKIGEYDSARQKLLAQIKPEKSLTETYKDAVKLVSERGKGVETAKRLAAVRNQINYKNKKDRGVGFKMMGFFKGGSGLGKNIEKTEKAIRSDPSLTPERKQELLDQLHGTTPQSQQKGDDKEITAPVDNATLQKALKMKAGELAQIIQDGSKAVGGKGRVWDAYVLAYTMKLQESASA